MKIFSMLLVRELYHTKSLLFNLELLETFSRLMVTKNISFPGKVDEIKDLQLYDTNLREVRSGRVQGQSVPGPRSRSKDARMAKPL